MKVKNLNVTVTYSVGLGELDIPENVLKEIKAANKAMDGIDPTAMNYPEASQWLSDNIREQDCCEWKCEIDDVE